MQSASSPRTSVPLFFLIYTRTDIFSIKSISGILLSYARKKPRWCRPS
jgi:hypothetical protein